jgi:hypothetical protein
LRAKERGVRPGRKPELTPNQQREAIERQDFVRLALRAASEQGIAQA